MSEKAFWGVSVSTKGDHSKLKHQPLQRHTSVWWRCVQMAHGERLNGGSGSSVHFVWGHRTRQDRLEQGPTNNAIPMQPSYIVELQSLFIVNCQCCSPVLTEFTLECRVCSLSIVNVVVLS